jgi:hypothetical protein
MIVGGCLNLEDKDVLPGDGPVMRRLTPAAFEASVTAQVVIYDGRLLKNRCGIIRKRNKEKAADPVS